MRKAQHFFSIIVLNWNGVKFLRDCFDSILSQKDSHYEIILADNNSSDHSIEFTQTNYPEVKIVSLKENKGYAGANNIASKRAKGEYLIFLNNDAKLDPNYLGNLYQFIQKTPQAKIVATEEYNYDGSKLVSHSDGIDFLGYPCRYQKGKVHYAPGCSFVIEKELFNKLDGFDEEMFIFREELDLCWRAYLIGEEPHIVNGCRFYHHTGGAIASWSIKRRYLSEKNNIRSILKNYSALTLLFILPIYMAVNLLEIVYLISTGQWKVVTQAYARAWLKNLKDYKDILKKHKEIQSQRVINDLAYLQKVCLVFGKWQNFKRAKEKLRFN
ncbi:MAG: glycosyltransferase family 2 protein [Candidatus Hodarchaeota archaeon]